MTSDPTTTCPNILAVLTVRNEGAFLLEWLAHHRAAGITDFLVFSNDCADGTDQMLDHLQKLGWLTHIRNDGPYDARGIQFTALKTARKTASVARADWILPLDIDEFINIKTGGHRVSNLFAALPDASAITLTWRLFGNAGVARYHDQPVTQTFTQCAPEVVTWPWRAAMFKTLYRNDGTYRALGVHRPRNPHKERLADFRWYDGAGRLLDDTFKTRRIFSDYGQCNTGLVQLNHYPLGAMESYVLKSDRGRAVHAADRLGLDYWVERNFNEACDTSIHTLAGETGRIRQHLLHDPVLAKLHRDAVNWRHARFDTLMRTDAGRALFGRLLMTPQSQMLPVQTARFLIEFAQGATDSDPAAP